MKTVLILGLCLAVSACDRSEPRLMSQAGIPADNTEKNERDRSAAAVLPLDQGNGDVDLGITQAIRKGVVGDDTMSMAAKNVKIITADGIVTLRGPVKSDGERTMIGMLAGGTVGVKRVDNLLEIAAD